MWPRRQAVGSSGATAIALDSESEEEGPGDGGLFAPMPALGGGQEDSDTDDEVEDDPVELHDGPPGMCSCPRCRASPPASPQMLD